MADGILNPIEQLEAEFDFDVYTKQEVDALLDEKADKSDTYTKTETDALLDEKADADAVYTKTETDTLLSAKADKSTTLAGYGITDAYTKTQTDNLLNGKADADSVYTKTEINTKIPNTVGSATKPTYVNGGVITECTYELNKTVPANAVFTDTTYSAGNGLNLSGTSFSAKAGVNVSVDGNGINVNGNGAVASADSGLVSGGTAYTELRPTLDGTWVKNAQTTAINLQKLEGGIEYLYAILSKQYDQLKKYINGNYYDYDTDANSKYTKSVPQGAMPYASLDSIGGKTVVWNQLVQNGNFADGTSGWSTPVTNPVLSASDGVLTVTAQNAPTAFYGLSVSLPSISHIKDHKILVTAEFYSPYSVDMGIFNNIVFGGYKQLVANTGTNTWVKGSMITTVANSYTGSSYFASYSGYSSFQAGDSFKIRNVMIHDLTLLYGAGNEPSTVAEFQQMFPASYYSYNAGTLLSAGVTEVRRSTVNLVNADTFFPKILDATKQSDGSWRYWASNAYAVYTPTYSTNVCDAFSQAQLTLSFDIKTDSATYVGKVVSVGLRKSNNTNAILQTISLSMDYTHYSMTIQNTTDVKIYFSFTNNAPYLIKNFQLSATSTEQPYEPYSLQTYSIPAEVQALTGYGWSAGSVYNYIDFERKVFVQNVGMVVVTENTSIIKENSDVDNFSRYYFSYDQMKRLYFSDTRNYTDLMVSDFGTVRNTFTSTGNDVGVTGYKTNVNAGKNWVYIFATQTTVEEFKTYLASHPITIYYELATPVETDISAYLTDNLIEVGAGGTLTFPNANGDDYHIPVPSEVTYMIDLQEAISNG